MVVTAAGGGIHGGWRWWSRRLTVVVTAADGGGHGGWRWWSRRLTVLVTVADGGGHGGWRWWRWLLLMVCEFAAYVVLLLRFFFSFSFGSPWLRCHGSPAPGFSFSCSHTQTHIIVVCHCLIKNTWIHENMDLYQPSLHWCLNNCNRSYKCFVICYLSWVTANVTNPEP